MSCMIEISCLMYAHLVALEKRRESKTSTDRYLRRKLTYLAQLRSKKRNFLYAVFHAAFLLTCGTKPSKLGTKLCYSFHFIIFFCNISPYCLFPVFKPASSWCNFSHSHYSIFIAALLYLHHCIIIIIIITCTFQIYLL